MRSIFFDLCFHVTDSFKSSESSPEVSFPAASYIYIYMNAYNYYILSAIANNAFELRTSIELWIRLVKQVHFSVQKAFI